MYPFLNAMGLDAAHRRACEEYGYDPDAEDPLEGRSAKEKARMLGKVEFARRRGIELQLTSAELREQTLRFHQTGVLAIELCGELLGVLRRAPLLSAAEARAERKVIAKRWNDFGEANWFHPKYRLPFYKLCERCDQPLVLVAQRKKRPQGASPSPVIHPWCGRTQHTAERRQRKKEKANDSK
ncbi:MAG: hypothetical protein SFW67_25955 [Myxococcaceae bacterium]|nr:hypothetical protein [Myxococcaceae bacterium]